MTVLYPRKGVSDLARMTPAAVEDKYGLTPSQYPDFAALRGDPSDNLPGIPGVGEKTATKWIREYGSFEHLVARADEVKGKVGESLRANLAQVITNRQLTELVREVPLDRAPGRPRTSRLGPRAGPSGLRRVGVPRSCVTGWRRHCRTSVSRLRRLRRSRCRPCSRPMLRRGWRSMAVARVGVCGSWQLGLGYRNHRRPLDWLRSTAPSLLSTSSHWITRRVAALATWLR